MVENSDSAYVDRVLDPILAAFIADRCRNKNVLLVEGARQVGKTRLVQHALSNIDRLCTSINLERDSLVRSMIDKCAEFREFEDLLSDRFEFKGSAGHVLFIDEAQESSRLGTFVRFMKEEWPDATVILSGSTLRRVFRPDTRYPVGRVKQLTVCPFTFSEFLRASGKPDLAEEVLRGELPFATGRHELLLSLFDRYIETGGLPQVACTAAAREDYRAVLAQISADYEEDFIRIFGEETSTIADSCLKSVANHVGNVSKNTSVVPSPSGALNEKINQVFARLEAWHMIIRCDQAGMSPEKSHKYLPKRYLFDSGFLRFRREIGAPSISAIHTLDADTRKPLGGALENVAAIELMRQFGEVAGWKKSSSGNEVDFVVKRDSEAFPIECKASLSMNKRHLRGISDYLNIYDLDRGAVISFAPFEVLPLKEGRSIINMPSYCIERITECMEVS